MGCRTGGTMKKKVFLTGASGFLGQILRDYLLGSGYEVVGLSRRRMDQEDEGLMTWLCADLSDPKSVMRDEIIDSLAGVDIIIHAAALYDLGAAHDLLYKQNVISTANVLHLARLLPKIPHVCLISTIAIAGDYPGVFRENMFDEGQRFTDSYASTKFAAEQMVRTAKDIPSRSVIRLGILVGSSIDGSIPKLDGPYYIMKLLHSLRGYAALIKRGKFVPVPFDEKSKLFMVPVDYAAVAIDRIISLFSQKSGLHVFHVTGELGGVSVRRVLAAMLEHYGLDVDILPVSSTMVPSILMEAIGIPGVLKNYMTKTCTFDDSNFASKVQDFSYPRFQDYSHLLFTYADQYLFSKGRNN